MNSPAALKRLVARVLGREPGIGFEISSHCPFGWPAVILSEPRDAAGRPNPNIYYLVCPFLRHEISTLEDGGFIRRLEQRIDKQPELAQALSQAQAEHGREWQKAAESMRQTMPDIIPMTPPNIAAAGSPRRLKCLHAHYAWFLTHPGYRIGALIAGELGDSRWCGDERCREIFTKMER